MRVYLFVEARWALDNIRKRRLKVCRFFDLNDPFELLGGGLGDKELRKKVKGWAEKLNKQDGLLCFTTGWKNPLMWSHYGERHKGMCLGFDVSDNNLNAVTYSPKRMPLAKWKTVGAVNPPNELRNSFLTTKYVSWEYEDERRVILPLGSLSNEGKLFFKPFDHTLKLVEVIAGHRCCVKWKPLIKGAVNDLPVVPKLIKARLAFRKFKVVTQRWGFEDPNAWQQCGDSCPRDHDPPFGAT